VFCNSHYISHFAAFFIVARTKISVAESYNCVNAYNTRGREGATGLRFQTLVFWLSGVNMVVKRASRALRRRLPGRPRLALRVAGVGYGSQVVGIGSVW
jgi:hypothetical protein